MALASGTRVSLRFCRERVTNTQPPGLGTPTTGVSMTAGSAASGESYINDTGNQFFNNGYTPGQWVKTSGFDTAANNTTWQIKSLTNGMLTVYDTGNVAVDESAASAQTVEIVMTNLRATGRNINLEKDLLESSEVDADGIETDVRHGFNRVTGAPGFELTSVDFDEPLALALGGTWTEITVSGAPTFNIDSSTDISRTTGDWITDGFRVGDRVRLSGSNPTATDDGDYIITAITGSGNDTITVRPASGSTLASDALSGSGTTTVAMPGKRLDLITGINNGADLIYNTFTMERAFGDITSYQVFNGCAMDGMQLNITPEAIVNGTFNILGMSAVAIDEASPITANITSGSGNSPFAAFDGSLYEGTTPTSNAVVTSMDFTISRNRQLEAVVGSTTSPDVFEGTAVIDGTVSAFFEDNAALFNRFINETETVITVSLQDPDDANTFINITLPRVKYNGASMDPPQQGPVTQDMPFRALKATGLAGPSSTTVNTSLFIQRSNGD